MGNYKYIEFFTDSLYISLQDEKLWFKIFITVHNGKAMLNEAVNRKQAEWRNFDYTVFMWNILLYIVQTQCIITNFQPGWLFLRMFSTCLSNILSPILPPFLSMFFNILALKQLAKLDLTFISVNILVFLNYTAVCF